MKRSNFRLSDYAWILWVLLAVFLIGFFRGMLQSSHRPPRQSDGAVPALADTRPASEPLPAYLSDYELDL